MKKLFRNRKWKAIYCLFPTLHCVQGMLGILKTAIRWSHSGLFYATMAVNMKKFSSGGSCRWKGLQVTCCFCCSTFWCHVEILDSGPLRDYFTPICMSTWRSFFSEPTMKSHLLFVFHIVYRACLGYWKQLDEVIHNYFKPLWLSKWKHFPQSCLNDDGHIDKNILDNLK